MKIIPSVLAKTENERTARLKTAATLSPFVQVDFIDGLFVPGVRTPPGPARIPKGKFTEATAHLLVNDPIGTLADVAGPGLTGAVFHLESVTPFRRGAGYGAADVIYRIIQAGLKVGVGVNPDTGIEHLGPFAKAADELLILAVDPKHPGVFISSVLKKIGAAKKAFPDLRVTVDGGVSLDNIAAISAAGADAAYIGHSIFDTGRSAARAYASLLKAL